jgi:hypothetical protein
MTQRAALSRARLTTPRAAAVAGILFSVLLIISQMLILLSVPADPSVAGDWLSGSWRTVNLALNLLPFAGIAFLWFIGVVRDRLGEQEDRLFSTVFLGSGLLFLAMFFASAGVAGGVIKLFGTDPGTFVDSGIYPFGRMVTYVIMNVYAMRMGGVFMVSTCTLSLRTRIIPRWMAILGLGLAVVLLVGLDRLLWVQLVFPLWVLLISVYILAANLRSLKGTPEGSLPSGEVS